MITVVFILIIASLVQMVEIMLKKVYPDLYQALGICPFLGVSKKMSTAAGMGVAVMFVMTLSTIATYLAYHLLLVPYQLEFYWYLIS